MWSESRYRFGDEATLFKFRKFIDYIWRVRQQGLKIPSETGVVLIT